MLDISANLARWNLSCSLYVPVFASIFILLMFHTLADQVALSTGGLMEYVLHAPRTGLVSSNKEGIISLAGGFEFHLPRLR